MFNFYFNFKKLFLSLYLRGGTGVAADAGVVAILINAEMVLDMLKSYIYNIKIIKMSII